MLFNVSDLPEDLISFVNSNTPSNSECGHNSPVCQRRKHLRATMNSSDDKNQDNNECDSGGNGNKLDDIKIMDTKHYINFQNIFLIVPINHSLSFIFIISEQCQ